ncbi:hypothetical protein [Glycomyces buryatensis]|uniref:Uncharacterized protein n=1 Tax=Glycomyces buryatensis TaxID=2570927 RepID=A0A4S8QGQ2_9ACTN|nr:hypothetical protein [Glycomyces buryatensis]THV40559.1 hypothetical protein FAB82_14935 [Glycomyces buryatensis]
MSTASRDAAQEVPIISTTFSNINHFGAVKNGALQPICGTRGQQWKPMPTRAYVYGSKTYQVKPEVSCFRCLKLRGK